MAIPRILVIPGSLRAKSYNVRLAALATKELMLADADVTRISLLDYPLPIYDADSASPGRSGATHSLLALRQVLAVGCRALVIAEQVTVPNAEQAFDEMDELKDARAASQLKVVVRKLIETAKLLT